MAINRKLTIRNERVKVAAHFHESGSILKGTKTGACDGFDIEFSVESDEPEEAIAALIEQAHRTCFTEDAVTHPVTLSKKHFLNGQPLILMGEPE